MAKRGLEREMLDSGSNRGNSFGGISSHFPSPVPPQCSQFSFRGKWVNCIQGKSREKKSNLKVRNDDLKTDI